MNDENTLKENHEKVVSFLNELIAACRNGAEGFDTAADGTKEVELKEIFCRFSAQRTQFAEQLQAEVARLGASPREHSTLGGSLHRGWIDLKAALARNDAHAVLAECERGEDAAVKAYRKALVEAPLTGAQRDLISLQATAVKQAHDEIKRLRDHPAFASTAK